MHEVSNKRTESLGVEFQQLCQDNKGDILRLNGFSNNLKYTLQAVAVASLAVGKVDSGFLTISGILKAHGMSHRYSQATTADPCLCLVSLSLLCPGTDLSPFTRTRGPPQVPQALFESIHWPPHRRTDKHICPFHYRMQVSAWNWGKWLPQFSTLDIQKIATFQEASVRPSFTLMLKSSSDLGKNLAYQFAYKLSSLPAEAQDCFVFGFPLTLLSWACHLLKEVSPRPLF